MGGGGRDAFLRRLLHLADQVHHGPDALDGRMLAAPGAVAGQVPAGHVLLHHPVLAADGHDVAVGVRVEHRHQRGVAAGAGHGGGLRWFCLRGGRRAGILAVLRRPIHRCLLALKVRAALGAAKPGLVLAALGRLHAHAHVAVAQVKGAVAAWGAGEALEVKRGFGRLQVRVRRQRLGRCGVAVQHTPAHSALVSAPRNCLGFALGLGKAPALHHGLAQVRVVEHLVLGLKDAVAPLRHPREGGASLLGKRGAAHELVLRDFPRVRQRVRLGHWLRCGGGGRSRRIGFCGGGRARLAPLQHLGGVGNLLGVQFQPHRVGVVAGGLKVAFVDHVVESGQLAAAARFHAKPLAGTVVVPAAVAAHAIRFDRPRALCLEPGRSLNLLAELGQSGGGVQHLEDTIARHLDGDVADVVCCALVLCGQLVGQPLHVLVPRIAAQALVLGLLRGGHLDPGRRGLVHLHVHVVGRLGVGHGLVDQAQGVGLHVLDRPVAVVRCGLDRFPHHRRRHRLCGLAWVFVCGGIHRRGRRAVLLGGELLGLPLHCVVVLDLRDRVERAFRQPATVHAVLNLRVLVGLQAGAGLQPSFHHRDVLVAQAQQVAGFADRLHRLLVAVLGCGVLHRFSADGAALLHSLVHRLAARAGAQPCGWRQLVRLVQREVGRPLGDVLPAIGLLLGLAVGPVGFFLARPLLAVVVPLGFVLG